MKATVTKEFTFDAAHRLPEHEGKCRNIHGHTYRVAVSAKGEIMRNGMVIDFGDLAFVKEWVDEHWDHAFIANSLEECHWDASYKIFFLGYPPTAERMAQHLLGVISVHYEGMGLEWTVRIWETPTSCAEVSE